ncbi:Speckle-type POZ protein-like B [Pseudolycoriella hygida]|uniref:Speckle-type POZ protein-like B n=1 Tax=Pseudolycoriella hygida TaxID=35572 RepID=A0A9Q0NAT5_9DIPT|nr:Speckle-type POZ protein-like B [Pseudolycoriella hygida]
MTTKTSTDLRLRLKNLFLGQKHTDCSFRIDNTIIHTHKIILATASSVFEAMFYGPLAECDCIAISDINVEAFQRMIMFIYTDEVDVTETTIEDLLELYYCAEKYLIDELVVKCCQLIKSSLNYQNILHALDLAVCMDVEDILKICLNFFMNCCLNCSTFSKIIQKNDVHISKECLNYILGCDIKEQNINLVCLIKEWCKTESQLLGLDCAIILKDLNIPDAIKIDVENMESLIISQNTFRNSRNAWMLCQRTYLRAVRPLFLRDNGTEFTTSLTVDRIVAVKSLIINSRLTPFIRNSPFAYTENINVTIRTSDDVVTSQKFIIFNVEYNSSVCLVFENAMLLSPFVDYLIEFKWDNYTFDNEYPKSIMSLLEKTDLCTFTFDRNLVDSNSIGIGSILKGIEYAVLN